MNRRWVILLEFILVITAVAAAVIIFRHPDRHDDKTATSNPVQPYYPKSAQACQRFTLEDAKRLLGEDAKAGTNPIYESNGANLYVSSCTYTKQAVPGQPAAARQAAALLMRQPKTEKGAQSNQSEFGLRPAAAQDVGGYGDGAFWDSAHGELNILKGNIWYILSIGPSTPSERSLDQTKSMADLLLPKL